MIETKEEYQELKRQAELQNWGSLTETIEALRKVARAAEDVIDIEQTHWSDWPSEEIYESERMAFSKLFWDKFNALPDWLKT